MTARGQVRNAYPAVRAFIFGQEVSLDVHSYSPTFADNTRAPCSCELVLAGPVGRYVVSEADIKALNPSVKASPEVTAIDRRVGDGFNVAPLGNTFALAAGVARSEAYYLSTANAADSLDAIVRRNLAAVVRDPIKQRVLEAKHGVRDRIQQPGPGETQRGITPASLAWLRGEAPAYPYQLGDCIFHSGDALRVFERDPFNPRVWYYSFTGFVGSWSTTDDANGEQLVTIRGEGPLRVLRYARFTTNPGLLDAAAVTQIEDTAVLTFQEDSFAELTLPEFVYTMIFGSETARVPPDRLRTANNVHVPGLGAKQRLIGVEQRTDIPAENETGAGAFDYDRSLIFTYGDGDPPQAVKLTLSMHPTVNLGSGRGALGPYLANVDHQVRAGDLEELFPSSLRRAGLAPIDVMTLPKDEAEKPRIADVITAIGTRPDLYPVDRGAVYILVPATMGPESPPVSLLSNDFKGPELNTQWSTRLSRLYDMLERAELSFFESPRGDLLIEFPLYDFDPADFGEEPVLATTRTAVTGATPAEPRGPYAPHFTFGRRDVISVSTDFSDENVRTQMRVSPNLESGWKSLGTAPDAGLPPQVVTLRSMVPAFGVRGEEKEAQVFIATPEAAAYYAQIKLNQLNANAKTLRAELVPSLMVLPNRPLLIESRYGVRVATVRKVTRPLVWGQGGSMEMSVDVNYVRGWSGQTTDDGRRLFEPIGGFASRPLNWALIFDLERAGASTKPSGGGG